VEFSPLLPKKKLTAFQRMGMCHVVKVILRFEGSVLPPLLHGCICSESFIPEFWFSFVSVIFHIIITINTTLRHLPDVPEGGYTCLAVGFAAGPSADAVSTLKPEETLKRALQQLDDMFRALPSSSFVDGLVHDWADEPFVRGGYSYPRVDFDENTNADAAAVVGGILFFAGEHTNIPSGMTAHAAVDSGKRQDDR
ncbi:unnamed protein product, partial [Ascophyllum nodosum]